MIKLTCLTQNDAWKKDEGFGYKIHIYTKPQSWWTVGQFVFVLITNLFLILKYFQEQICCLWLPCACSQIGQEELVLFRSAFSSRIKGIKSIH